jgi:tRNA (guanine-N7-)-methyltransferase
VAKPDDLAVPARRRVRSFVRREGRITAAQTRALEELWPRYGLTFEGRLLDLDAVFGRRALRVIEIGFGNGEALLECAQRNPERDFIGIEVHAPGVGRVLRRIRELELTNLRIAHHDAVEVLDQQIPDAAIAEILIFFPDPWPKKRHHKRRLIQPEFATLLARKLAPGGVLRLATDWQHYAEQMLEVLSACHMLRNCATDGGYVTRPPSRQPTRFEVRGQRLGHGVWDLAFERREDVAVTSPQD